MEFILKTLHQHPPFRPEAMKEAQSFVATVDDPHPYTMRHGRFRKTAEQDLRECMALLIPAYDADPEHVARLFLSVLAGHHLLYSETERFPDPRAVSTPEAVAQHQIAFADAQRLIVAETRSLLADTDDVDVEKFIKAAMRALGADPKKWVKNMFQG
ncbi:MAG: hypothetical protein AAGF92_15020 [Myxococcota bacterium]